MSKKAQRSSTGSFKLLTAAEGLYFDFKQPRIAPALSPDTSRQAVQFPGAHQPTRSNRSLNQINIPTKHIPGIAKIRTCPWLTLHYCRLPAQWEGCCHSRSAGWKHRRASSLPCVHTAHRKAAAFGQFSFPNCFTTSSMF